MMQSISLNKFIADSGYCSRREADDLIAAERVMINDNLAKVGARITTDDIISVDFEIIKHKTKEDTIVLAYNKPEGLTCTTELTDRSSIMHFIKYPKRIFPIGRLDKDSQGLLLLTNDGDIVNKILRAGNEHEKEYWVTLKSPYDKEFLRKMSSGVHIGGGITTLPCKIKPISPRKFSITLVQGLNRQIRKMCAALDAKVDTLQRVRIMHIYIGDLGAGKLRRLNDVELNKLLTTISGSTNAGSAAGSRKMKSGYKKPNPTTKTEIVPEETVYKKYVAPKGGRAENRTGSKKPKPKPKAKEKPVSRAKPKTAIKTEEPAKKGSYKAYRNNKKD
jgi:23S rRNA pseudouridine2604 synthase